MQRISIRNINSQKKVKPRLFDLIKENDNHEWIVEIQGKEGKEKSSFINCADSDNCCNAIPGINRVVIRM